MTVVAFPTRPRPVPIDMARRVQMNRAETAAWAKTPQGRLLASLNALRVLGYQHTADRAGHAYRASLVPGAVDPVAVGAAIIELLSIPDADPVIREHVRAGCQALAEMLGGENQPQGAA